MKTIIWKEWRQCGWSVAAGLVVMTLALWYTLRASNLIFDSTGQWPVYATLIGGVFALLLGTLQSRGDHHPAARALLLHRAVSASTIFWGKYVAGITMFLAAITPPFLYLMGYFLVDQRQTIAAQPSMVLPGLFGALAGFAFWPVAVTVVHSDAKFIGSRLLILIGCVALLAGLVFSIGDTNNVLIWLTWALIPLVVATVLAREMFVLGRVKEAPQRTMLWLANAFTLVLLFTFGVGSLMETPYRGKRYSVTVGPGAQPWLVEQSFGVRPTQLKMAPLSQQRSVRELVEFHKNFNQGEHFQIDKPTNSTVIQSMIQLPGFNDLGPSEQQHEVIFDNVVGEILVYRDQGLGRELIRQISPDSAPMGRFIAQANVMQSIADRGVLMTYQSPNGAQPLIVCSNGLFLVDDVVESVTPLLEFPFGSKIGRVVSFFDEDTHSFSYAIRVDDDAILLSLKPAEKKPAENEPLENSERRAAITADSIFLERVRIPESLRPFDSFSLARSTKGQGRFVGIGHPTDRSQNSVDVLRVEFDADGEAIDTTVYRERLGFDHLHGDLPSVAAIVPAGLFAIATVFDWATSERPDLLGRMWNAARTEPSHLAWGIFTALLGLAVAIAVARRRGLSSRQIGWWSLAGVLLGPVGALAILTVYPPINRHACSACGKMTRVDDSNCVHCGIEESELPRRGIEIFEGDQNSRRDVLVNV